MHFGGRDESESENEVDSYFEEGKKRKLSEPPALIVLAYKAGDKQDESRALRRPGSFSALLWHSKLGWALGCNLT